VDCPHGARTLTNGSRDSFHGARPNVAYGEDARCRGLERQRLPFGKDGVFKGASGKRSIGQDEPLFIEHDAAL
jgi:hypothetical protein